jgi:hypothetical protein
MEARCMGWIWDVCCERSHAVVARRRRSKGDCD